MASKKKPLGHYVRERHRKYRHPFRILVHVSTAPRKILVPRRTTYQIPGNDERQHSLLFLCPLGDVKAWTAWYISKIPRSRLQDIARAYEKRSHIVLYAHVVRVDPADLEIPMVRFYHEYFIQKAIRPDAIVPIRYTPGKPLNLSRVASKIEQVKKIRRRP